MKIQEGSTVIAASPFFGLVKGQTYTVTAVFNRGEKVKLEGFGDEWFYCSHFEQY